MEVNTIVHHPSGSSVILVDENKSLIETILGATPDVAKVVDVLERRRNKKHQKTDQDLEYIEQIQCGDGRGLDSLMQRHSEALNRFIFSYTNNAEDAADITQDTFVRVFKKSGNFKPSATVKTWIYTIALNLCRDRGRRIKLVKWIPFLCSSKEGDRQSEVKYLDVVDRPDPSELSSFFEFENIIAKEIAALPDKLKGPFNLYVLDELPQSEVAEVLNITVKSVETRVYRARRILKDSLRPILKEFGYSGV